MCIRDSGKPATGTTTSTLTATSYVTTTVTDYMMGTTHITRDHTSQGTWASSTTYSTEIETYAIRAFPTEAGVETISPTSKLAYLACSRDCMFLHLKQLH